ncbi:hypothetical protein WJX77_009735 [Trebouxia sp. C0004]
MVQVYAVAGSCSSSSLASSKTCMMVSMQLDAAKEEVVSSRGSSLPQALASWWSLHQCDVEGIPAPVFECYAVPGSLLCASGGFSASFMSQHPGSAPVPETQGTQRPVRGVLSERRLIQGTLTPRNTPYFRQNGASCSRARSAVDPGGSAQEHQDENIQQPSDPTQQTWYQDPELPERKKMKLQQGQCLIRLLDKQSSLLQQLIATTTSRTSSPAHVDRLQHDNCAIGECY